MFFLAQRADTLPEVRVLVNSDHVVGALASAGGARTKLYLDTGESWEINMPFQRTIALLRNEPEPRQPPNS